MAPPPICACVVVGAAVTIAAISVVLLRTKWKVMESKFRELEKTLAVSVENYISERQGRIRAQQALRKAMLQVKSDKNVEATSFPMTPIGTVQSCFSTRNGTPRQPLLVPLARARLVFDPARVPNACLEGLEQYSHCWVIFVFHLNTNLDKLWKDPSQSKMKAKVRVPRLEGGRMGVLATRSPHRPIPIGLTIEAVKGHMVLLSGIDLVDGTPVLDIKPYLPYCDSIQNASVPDWIMENNTLYSSADEIRNLIKQILSWDIRSSSQRTRPHKSSIAVNCEDIDNAPDIEKHKENGALDPGIEHGTYSDVIYHLMVESLDISYKIETEGNVIVEGVSVDPTGMKDKQRPCNYMLWDDKLRGTWDIYFVSQGSRTQGSEEPPK
ncbi:hypothetical protein V2J09_000329 [Rumex salicifolius]